MADNYIEKRMAEIASGSAGTGGSTFRFNNIDALTVRSAEAVEIDTDFKLHSLQMATIENIIGKAGIHGIRTVREADDVLAFAATETTVAQRNDTLLAAGRAMQMGILKAADMGLYAVPVVPADPSHIAAIRIGRKK